MNIKVRVIAVHRIRPAYRIGLCQQLKCSTLSTDFAATRTLTAYWKGDAKWDSIFANLTANSQRSHVRDRKHPAPIVMVHGEFSPVRANCLHNFFPNGI